MQKSSKTIFLITIVLVSLLCLTAVSAAGDDATIIGDYSSADDIEVTASEDAQTVENTNDDASYDSLGAIANDTGDLDQSTNAASPSDVLADGESNSFTNLANSISNAGSYLSLNGNYAYDSTIDTDYANGITISKDITINGGGSTTISGNDLTRIFNIENGYSVVLLDITFTNGKADNGGAIYNDGTLVLKDCKFTDNSADYGAAIYNTANGAISGDADFTDNTATYRGGGIYSEGTVDLSDSTFDGNDITYRLENDENGGAAIYNKGGTLSLDSTQVTNNIKNIVIRDGNNGDLISAAVYTTGDAAISNSYFENNAGSWGAGIYVTNDATLTVTGTTFKGNKATFGSAIYDENAHIIVDDCDFIENEGLGVGSSGTSSTQGAAILVMESANSEVQATASIKNSRFNKNKADLGGAVSFAAVSGESSIEGCTFTENTALSQAGAVRFYGDDEAALTITDSNFTENTASSIGGAAYTLGGKTTIEGCAFTENSAPGAGGAIYLAGETEIGDTSFNKNTGGNGGAIFVNDAASGSAISADFSQNTATGMGGAVYVRSNADISISDSEFTENTAGTLGDSIIVQSGASVDMSYLNLDNTGDHYAIYNNGGNLDMDEIAIDGEGIGICNVGGTISPIKATVTVDGVNHKVYSPEDELSLKAVVTDESGNAIFIDNLYFVFTKGDTKEVVYAAYSAEDEAYVATYTPVDALSYTVTVEFDSEAEVEYEITPATLTSTQGTFTDLDWKIYEFCEAVSEGSSETTLILDYDFAYVPEIDDELGIDLIAIYGPFDEDNQAIPITIDGNGHTISGSGLTQIMNLLDGIITFKNIRFADAYNMDEDDGYSGTGGAVGIQDDGEFKFINCTFENNKAIWGAAICTDETEWNTANLIIDGCTFKDNEATYGGAIYNFEPGTVTVEDSEFIDNTAAYGNSIYNAGTLNVGEDNTGLNDEDIYIEPGALSQLQSLIEEAESGSIISLSKDMIYDVILDSEFTGIVIDKDITIDGNEFKIDGNELVRLFEISNGATLILKNIIISNFVGNEGPAVYVDAGAKLITDGVTFENNVADYAGGAIYAAGDLTVTDSTFTKNEASHGGAIYIDPMEAEDGVVVASIKDSAFTENTAGDGGAISDYYGTELTIDNCDFIKNTADEGGAISSQATLLTIKDSAFTENTAPNGEAGAISFTGEDAVITDSTFTKNSAYANGGAIYINANGEEDVVIDGCTFTENSASDGGAILSFWRLTVADSTFTDNSADYGGAIANMGGLELSVTDSTFTGNTATEKGNAIYNDESSILSLSGNTMSATSADVYSEGVIDTPIYVVVMDGGVYTVSSTEIPVYATVKDDNGNLINNHNLAFTLNGNPYEDAVFNPETGLFEATFTFETPGDYIVSVVSTVEPEDEEEPYEQLTVTDATIKYVRGTFTDLQNIIDNAEGFASLPDYNFAYDPDYDGADLADGVIINKTIILFGTNNIISGSDAARIFKVVDDEGDDSTFFLLSDVTLTNGKADYGGAVYVSEGTFFNPDSVKFIENTATYRGGAIYSEGTVDVANSVIDSNNITFRTRNDDNGGAAIYNLKGDLSIKNTNITNNLKDIVIRDGNSGDLLVGVVVTSGYTFIEDSLFENNTGSWGGAISSLGYMNDEEYTLSVTGTTFNGNNATFGGAIFVESSNLVVDDCTFNNNKGVGVGSSGTSNTQGGAIVVFPNGAKATITGSTFTANSANTGGAVSLAGVDQDSLIEGCTFTDNTASDGGAVYLWTQDDAAVTVKDSTFTGNTADWGNAISTDGALKLEGNTISSTSADIGNWAGSIESKVIAVILANDTYNWHMGDFVINATLTDDNGNMINDHMFNFVISQEGSDDIIVPATFYTNLGYYQGTFTPAETGEYLISIDYPESEVQTSVVKISRTFIDLLNLIINAEDGVVELDGDYSYVAEFDAALKDGIVIDEVTTIIGNGFTICGEDSARIFYVSSSVLDLQNLTICHGAAEKGAGVYVDADSILTADGVTFTENVAVKRGGAIYSEGIAAIYNSTIDSNDITFRTKNDDNGGAAIYNLNGQLYIENTNITNNLKDIVIRNGNAGDLLVGVVVTSGETTIKDSYFANNTGSWGGAVSSLGYMNDNPYTLTVTGTTFEGNNATFGGAIFVESSNLVVDDCTFNNNKGVGVGSSGTSNTQGGAIVVFPDGAKATITDSTFTANSANTGGAVSLAGVDQDSLIEGCTFTDNTASDGGAVYLWTGGDAAVTIKDSVFSGNTAGWGNAISTDGALKLEGNTISTTSADIGNYFGSIESEVIVQILGNDTTEGAGIVEAALGDTVPVYAVVTDDNGNLIIDISLVFTISSNAGTKSLDASYNADTNKYEAEYDIESAGKHLVSITSSVNEFLVINTGLIDVPKADVTITLNVEDINEGQKAVVTGQIIGIDDTGIAADIIVVVNDVDYNVTTTVEENGTFSFEIPDLTAGSYGAFAIFFGDNNYNYGYASDLFEVKERQLAVVVTNLDDLQNFVYGDQVTLEFKVTDAITGDAVTGAHILISNYDDADISYYDEEGNYQVNLGMLKPGDYGLSALFTVEGYEPLTYEPINVKVSKADIELIVTRISGDIKYGEGEIIAVGTNNSAFVGTVIITLTNGYTGEVKTIEVDIDPEDEAVEGGFVQINAIGLDVATYTIAGTFAGNDGYNAASAVIETPYNQFTVSKAKTDAGIVVSNVPYGEDIEVSILLIDELLNPIDGTVHVTIADIFDEDVTVENGFITFNVTNTLNAGNDYDASVIFRHTSNYEASDDYVKFNVTALENSIVINPVEDVPYATEQEGTFTIVDGEGNPITDFDADKVSVTVGETTVDVIIKDGVGTYTIPASLAVGPHTVAVVFAGDNKYAGSDATATVVVKQASALVTITSPSEITYGDALTVETALTSGGQAIDGTVDVVVTDAQGNEVTDYSKLPVGTYTITATFAGNDNYLGDEAVSTVVVKQADSSVTVIPIAEINVGETQSITVTVGPEGAEGTVKVIVTGDGYSFSMEYSVYELEDPITLEDLSEGDYSINVIFNAGDNYGLSTASADFTVKATEVVAKVNSTFINFGENVTVTIEGMPEDVTVSDLNITDNGKEIAVTLNGNEFVYAPAESGDHVIAINYNGTAYDKFYTETSFTVAPEGEYTVIPANNSAEAVQEAINNAPAGATIKLADNTTYDLAGVELNNSVTIAGGEGTVITVPAGQSSAFVAAANASDVNIKNVKFVATSDNQSLLSVTPNDLGGGISQVPAITIENVTAIPAAGVNESTISLLNVNTSSNPFKPSSDVSISKNIMASGVSSLKTNASALSGNVALKKAVKTTLTGANTQKVYAIPYKAAKSGKYYSVTLKDANGNVLAGKNVKFTLAGKTYTVKTDAKGVAKLAINIYKPGTYKLAVSFAGEATLGASSKQATIKILKNKVKITRKTKKVKRSAKKRTLKYYVKTKTGKKMGIKGVKVYLKINKKTYKAKTNKKGLVKFKVKLPRVKKTYKVKVIFKGNKANKKKTLKTKVKVY